MAISFELIETDTTFRPQNKMKTLTLIALVASLALATNAMADTSAYNSKATTGKVLAPSTTAVLAANDFNGVRQSSKVQTSANASAAITKTDRVVTCSKPMAPTVCKAHCG